MRILIFILFLLSGCTATHKTASAPEDTKIVLSMRSGLDSELQRGAGSIHAVVYDNKLFTYNGKAMIK